MRKWIAIPFLLSGFCSMAQYQKAEVAFTIPEKDLIPEGIAYDPQTETFYVGSISKKKIIAIAKNGKAKDFIATGQDGIGNVLGMKVLSGVLWACNNTGENEKQPLYQVHQYDLRAGKLIRAYAIPGDDKKHFLNDLVITKAGEIFITDTNGGAVFKIDLSKQSIEKFIESDELIYANGITSSPDEKKLIVSTGRGLMQVEIATKKISSLGFGSYYMIGIDGLYQYKNTFIGIQNVTFPISINRYYLNKDMTAIERGEVLNAEDPLFHIPTTGVIVGDWFYFIANTHLDQWDDATNKIKENAMLNDVVIAKIKIK
jgi:hypothetical protein